MNKRKHYFNESYFDIIDTEDKAYYLGFIIADGNIYNGVRIEIHNKDIEILNTFKNCIKYTGDISFRNNRNMAVIRLNSKYLERSIAKYGVIPNKTNKTYFPEIPEYLYPHFIRGYFDGDGYIGVINTKCIDFRLNIVGTFQLITKLQGILIKNCNISKTKLISLDNKKSNIVRMSYGGKFNIIKIFDYLYKDSTIYLKRKKEKFIVAKNTPNRKY